MFQNVEGRRIFVVDLSEIPELPIHDGGDPQFGPYAKALDTAIRTGIVKEPGKYGIEVTNDRWNIWTIQE